MGVVKSHKLSANKKVKKIVGTKLFYRYKEFTKWGWLKTTNCPSIRKVFGTKFFYKYDGFTKWGVIKNK